jgi:hypothetical protein
MTETRSSEAARRPDPRFLPWWASTIILTLLLAGCAGTPLYPGGAGPRTASAPTASPSPPTAVLATFDVGGDGWAMRATQDHLWIQVDEPVDAIVRVDKRTGEAAPLVPGGHKAQVGSGGLWVEGGNWVAQVDETTGKLSHRLRQGGGFTLGEGSGWLHTDDGTVDRVDLRTGKLHQAAHVDPALCQETKGIAMAFGVVWLACKEGRVVRVPLDGSRATVIPTGLGTHTFAVTDDALWVTNYEDGTISRIDPRSAAVTTVKDVGSGVGIAAGGGYVWSGDWMGIAKIDPRTAKVVGHLAVPPGSYYELVWDDGVIWASTRGPKVLKIDARS